MLLPARRCKLIARFSSHPAIALPSLEPWAYGNVFYNRAKALLGSMLSVPSREAIAGFVMLAHMSFANGQSAMSSACGDGYHFGILADPADSESELWMLTGMAVRMSIDLGLHIVGVMPYSSDLGFMLLLMSRTHRMMRTSRKKTGD